MNATNSPHAAKPGNLVQAIERASSILEVLGQSPQGMSVKELSERVNLSRGTTHRLLSSLAYFDYVRQDPETRHYFLGFKLVELGNRLLNQLKFRTEAKPFLTDLAQRAKETVYLVVLDQNEILYVDKVEPDEYPSGLAMVSKVGTRIPAHACAVGKVLLSQLTQDRLDQLIKDKGLPKRTDKTITDPARLKEHLFSVRNQGYAVDDEENERGIRCVAAPVRDEEGRVIAAISVSGPTIRLTKKTIQDTFRHEAMATALKISQQLGFKDLATVFLKHPTES